MIKSKDLLIRKIIVASIIIIILLTIISKENTKDILNKEVSEQKIQNTVAVYIQDESSADGYSKADTIPTSGYAFNEEMSYCGIDGKEMIVLH